FGNDWTQGAHLSLLADDEARALVSLYDNGAHTSGRFHDEVIELSTDGSQSVRRLAHHRSLVQGYDDTPRANISRDRCFGAFTSNWAGRRRRHVFPLKLSNCANTFPGACMIDVSHVEPATGATRGAAHPRGLAAPPGRQPGRTGEGCR